MKINIRAVHFELSEEARDYSAEKIGRLEDFYKNIIMSDIAIENHESEQKDKYHYIAKVTISVPGKDIFAEGTGPDEFSAIDNVEQKLKGQIERLKSKQEKGRFNELRSTVRRWLGKE